MSTQLGFGCANLYQLPVRRDREALLEAAYDLGIRHFDVAPIYGLGLAERELADFLRRRQDVVVATKFGIRPTAVGRFAGLVQSPIRRVLRASSSTNNVVKSSGKGPDSGVVGQLLYSPKDYSAASAKRALASSLRALGRGYVDYFFLHEPVGARSGDLASLSDYLERQSQAGTISRWGAAGDLSVIDAELTTFIDRASAVQLPYQLCSGYDGPAPDGNRHTLTFGVLSTSLPRVKALLARRPELRSECSEELDADLGCEEVALKLLIRDAIHRNKHGTVLVSSTNLGRLTMTCTAARTSLRNEVAVAEKIRAACLQEPAC